MCWYTASDVGGNEPKHMEIFEILTTKQVNQNSSINFRLLFIPYNARKYLQAALKIFYLLLCSPLNTSTASCSSSFCNIFFRHFILLFHIWQKSCYIYQLRVQIVLLLLLQYSLETYNGCSLSNASSPTAYSVGNVQKLKDIYWKENFISFNLIYYTSI